jgi:hypothetical protein
VLGLSLGPANCPGPGGALGFALGARIDLALDAEICPVPGPEFCAAVGPGIDAGPLWLSRADRRGIDEPCTGEPCTNEPCTDEPCAGDLTSGPSGAPSSGLGSAEASGRLGTPTSGL